MKTHKLMAAVFFTLLLCGCATTSVSVSAKQSPGTPAPTPTASIYTLTAAETKQCTKPPISTRILAGRSTSNITPDNSEMALPDELKNQGTAAVDAATKAWESLPLQERIFQLCLRGAQAGVISVTG